MPHGRSVVAVPLEARRAEIAQELGQIFRSPRVRQKEEQGNGPLAQRQWLSSFNHSPDGPDNQSLGPQFVPQRNTNRSTWQLTRRSHVSTGSCFNRTVILIPDPEFSELPRGRLQEHIHDAGLEE